MTAAAQPRRAIALGATALTVLPADVDGVTIERGFKVSVGGLQVDGDPTLAQCERAGMALRVVERGAPFALGDFINYVETKFGEAAAQIIDAESGWSEQTVSVYRWLAARVAPERRRMDRLGVQHHILVAALTPGKQERWLKAAANDGGEPWTVRQLRDAIATDADVAPSAWFVIVACTTAKKQAALLAQLEREGYACKAAVSRRRKMKAASS